MSENPEDAADLAEAAAAAEELIVSQFRRLAELRDKSDELKASSKIATAEYREYEAELYEQMEHGPFKGSRKFDLGEPFGTITFTPRATPYGRVIDDEATRKYFEDRGELKTLIDDDWIGRRLNEIAKERLEKGEGMPPGMDFTFRRGITISKQDK